MSQKKLIAYINAENEVMANVIDRAVAYSNEDIDEIFIYNYSAREEDKEEMLLGARNLSKQIDTPFILGIKISKLEDVKKAIYTGASKVMIKDAILEDKGIIKEAADRFGKDKIIVEIEDCVDFIKNDVAKRFINAGAGMLMLKHVDITSSLCEAVKNCPLPIIIRDALIRNNITELMGIEGVYAVATNYYVGKKIAPVKKALKDSGIDVETFSSSILFDELKKDSNGLVPVIVQDYKTDEVLMMAYMNEEAYNKTFETGYMTYFSRSRQSLWVKGETSGHFQFVKKISVDCDKDTLLAKVKQIGAACHTGNRSCFYTEVAKKEYNETNPNIVLNRVYDVIMDRKEHPKLGSYTNYLFEKGIDKILKKCGEEATEIVIAAKNPESEELKYEISDFLYHMMVLMAERGLDWEDITQELANRE